MAEGCASCAVWERYVATLERQVEEARVERREMVERLVAIANPQALAMARGEKLPGPVMTQEDMADFVDHEGHGYVMIEGKLVPLTEVRDVQAKLDEAMNGARS